MAAQKGRFLPRELNNAAAIPLIAVQLESANETLDYRQEDFLIVVTHLMHL